MQNHGCRRNTRILRASAAPNVTAMNWFGWLSKIGRCSTRFGPVPTQTIFRCHALLMSPLNPLGTIHPDFLRDTEQPNEFGARTHDDEKVLSVVFDAEDGQERHINPFEYLRVDRAGKITE